MGHRNIAVQSGIINRDQLASMMNVCKKTIQRRLSKIETLYDVELTGKRNISIYTIAPYFNLKVSFKCYLQNRFSAKEIDNIRKSIRMDEKRFQEVISNIHAAESWEQNQLCSQIGIYIYQLKNFV